LDSRCPTFPVTIPRMKIENQLLQAVPIQAAEDQQFIPPNHHANLPPSPVNDALQSKAAEYWLKLGEADQALRELEHLPQNTWRNRAAVKIRIAAIGMLRERREMVEAVWSSFRHSTMRARLLRVGVRRS
jgi:hypothetical protein